jgi:hypothetical protein
VGDGRGQESLPPNGSYSWIIARPVQTSGQIGFRSTQGRVVGHLAWPVSDPCLMSGRVGLARASLFDVSSRGGFQVGSGFLALGRVFSGFGSKSWLVPGP